MFISEKYLNEVDDKFGESQRHREEMRKKLKVISGEKGKEKQRVKDILNKIRKMSPGKKKLLALGALGTTGAVLGTVEYKKRKKK